MIRYLKLFEWEHGPHYIEQVFNTEKHVVSIYCYGVFEKKRLIARHWKVRPSEMVMTMQALEKDGYTRKEQS